MRFLDFKQALFKTVAVAVGLALVLAMGEIFFIAGYSLWDGEYMTVQQYLAREQKNTYITDLTQGRCRYVDSLFPHPYLAFVHHQNPPCCMPHVNRIGMLGREYPFARSAEEFVILLTGGSVAAQFVGLKKISPNYLEDELNRKFHYDNRRFVVLNGGAGAWKQPQQAILFLMYADVVDAVITLDGANEHYMVADGGKRFEWPANNFFEVNPVAGGGFTKLFWIGLDKHIFEWQRGDSFLQGSKLCYFVTSTVRDQIRRCCDELDRGGTKVNRTTLASIFAAPTDLDAERLFEWQVSQYKKYIVMMHAVAKEMNIFSAHFVQPCPAIGKNLSKEELRVVGDLSYGPLYRRMTDRLMDLNRRGVPVFSLLDVFRDHTETLYADWIHCKREPLTGVSEGYRIIASRMADLLSHAWKLPSKEAASGSQVSPDN